jgi:hypothetical protein
MEADLARDLPAVDLNNYGIITDRLGRIAETLGLRRTPRPTDANLTLSAISHSRIRAERQSGGQE